LKGADLNMLKDNIAHAANNCRKIYPLPYTFNGHIIALVGPCRVLGQQPISKAWKH
jgi:hypothetical protein